MRREYYNVDYYRVLMHRLALGLSDEAAKQRNHLHPEVLMRLLALGAF